MAKANNTTSTTAPPMAPTPRRLALGGMLVLLATSAAATIPAAIAAQPSPVAAMMQRLADLMRQYGALEDAEDGTEDGIAARALCREMWALEAAIVTATPSTMEDAAAILFVTACEVDSGRSSAPSKATNATLERAEHAVRRVALFVGRTAGMDLKAVVGNSYLAEHLQARDPARVA